MIIQKDKYKKDPKYYGSVLNHFEWMWYFILLKSPLNGKQPSVHPDVFIAPTAVVIGDVAIEEGANIWFSAVLRADWGKIIIGENTNCLENCTITAGPYTTVKIGENCVIGQNACVIGSCHIGSYVSIGSNVTVLQNTRIQGSVIIDPNCVIPEGMVCRSKTRYGGTNVVEIQKVFLSELTVNRLVSRESSYYGENSMGYKESLDKSEKLEEELIQKVKNMSINREKDFSRFFK